MTVSTNIRDWLLKVGSPNGVREAWEDRRPANSLSMPNPYFIYWFEDSDEIAGTPQNLTELGATNDANITYSKGFVRSLYIFCHVPMQKTLGDEIDGMRMLEKVRLSASHVEIRDILEGRTNSDPENLIEIQEMDQISNQTVRSEKSIERIYLLHLRINLNTQFALEREDHFADTYDIAGTVIAPDEVKEFDVATSGTT